MSLLISQANAGCVDRMRAMGRSRGVIVVVVANRMERFGFSEAAPKVQIVMVLGIVLVFQSGVTFMALNQG